MKDGIETQVCDGEEGQNNKEVFLDHAWKPGKLVERQGAKEQARSSL